MGSRSHHSTVKLGTLNNVLVESTRTLILTLSLGSRSHNSLSTVELRTLYSMLVESTQTLVLSPETSSHHSLSTMKLLTMNSVLVESTQTLVLRLSLGSRSHHSLSTRNLWGRKIVDKTVMEWRDWYSPWRRIRWLERVGSELLLRSLIFMLRWEDSSQLRLLSSIAVGVSTLLRVGRRTLDVINFFD